MIKNIFLALLITTQAYAGLPPTSIQGQSDASPKTKFNFQAPNNQITDLGGIKALIETGNSNILPDPGFEAATSGWTASGGATATANATAKGTGTKGYDWDSNSAGQTLMSTSVTIPNGYQGKNGFFSCNIKTVSGTATHTITVNDGTNDIATAFTIPNSTTSFISTYNNGQGNFIYPASGTIRIKLTSVNANEPEIYLDDCKIGLAENVGSVVPQAILVDAVTVTGCASNWAVTSTSFAAFGTQTGCVYTSAKGVATAPSTNIPGFKFASLPAGDYAVEYEGQIQSANAAVVGFYQFTDGTNTAREIAQVNTNGGYLGVPSTKQTISYSSPQSNVTLQMYGKSASSNINIYGTTANPGTFRLWYFPSSSQQAVSSAQADYSGATYALTASNTQGFGTPTNASCTHDRVGGNLLLNCKWTSGTVTASEARVNLPNGLISADTTRIPSLLALGSLVQGSNAGTFATYVLIEPSVGYVSFGIQAASYSGLVKANANTFSASSNPLSFSVSIPIQGWSSNQRAPTLVGSVTSNATNAERIERAFVSATCSASPCTIASGNSGSWLTNITRTAAGTYSANFAAGVFSSAPSCMAWNHEANRYMISSGAPSTSAWAFQTSLNADSGFNLICMGSR